MKPALAKRQRCAVYTRKSTEHNLDLAFNSLDAQREACEAFIKSQAHEGWTLVPARFDDGGLSGASLDRPALQLLLEEVRARKIDIVVVYKVDRLTRSLADFAKLVEVFDEHDVSFVSVTQSFNTTSSMGRLTLNVLLSFAQFEREVIGERVRDKIAASKRKGLWMGGNAPLGYRSINKKLEIVPEEADLVRKIFSDYLRLGSLGALATSLEAEGVRPPSRSGAKTGDNNPRRFGPGQLAYLLKNRIYVGEIVHRGEAHAGHHEPILDRDLFEAAQAALAAGVVRHRRARSLNLALLAGKTFDDRGNRMSPSHANKKGVRYRYYVSQALLKNRPEQSGTVRRVCAPDVETLVLRALRQRRSALEASADAIADRDLVEAVVERVTIHPDRIAVRLKGRGLDHASEHHDAAEPVGEADEITIPFRPDPVPRKGVLHPPRATDVLDAGNRDAILCAVSRAQSWMTEVTEGRTTFDDIAARERIAPRYVQRLAGLAYLSPKLVEAVIEGTVPAGLTVTALTQSLAVTWAEQEKIVMTSPGGMQAASTL